jgi:hypothetical protein
LKETKREQPYVASGELINIAEGMRRTVAGKKSGGTNKHRNDALKEKGAFYEETATKEKNEQNGIT